MKNNENDHIKSVGQKTSIAISKGEFKKYGVLKNEAFKAIKYIGISNSIVLFVLSAIIFFIAGFKIGGFYRELSFLIGILFFLIVMDLYSLISYCRSLKCTNCGNDFAYEDEKKPDIKEISSPYDYSAVITRYYKCMFCGHRNIVESSGELNAGKGKMLKSDKFNSLSLYLIRIFG